MVDHLLVYDAPLTLQASALKTKNDWDLEPGNQEVVRTMKLPQLYHVRSGLGQTEFLGQ